MENKLTGDVANFFTGLDDTTKEDFLKVKRIITKIFGKIHEKAEETQILCEITNGFRPCQISKLLFKVFARGEKIKLTRELIIATPGRKIPSNYLKELKETRNWNELLKVGCRIDSEYKESTWISKRAKIQTTVQVSK